MHLDFSCWPVNIIWDNLLTSNFIFHRSCGFHVHAKKKVEPINLTRSVRADGKKKNLRYFGWRVLLVKALIRGEKNIRVELSHWDVKTTKRAKRNLPKLVDLAIQIATR